MKNIFITGAAGFIGFHLAKALTLRGDRVIGYDNFNSYYNPSLKYARATRLQEMGVTIIQGDILDRECLNSHIQNHQTTHLVHLAAQAGVRYSLQDPQAYIKANVEGFVNILEICRCRPEMNLTYASSSSVYGLNTKVPFSVTDPTDRQASLYGTTKKSNELLAATYHHLYGICVTGLRFFTVYGPWGRPDMAYYTFTKAILEESTIDLYNYGKMQRDFTYIDDIVQGTTSAIDLGASCEVFNLGNNKPVELCEFVAIIEKCLHKKAIVRQLPMQQGDVVTTYADIDYSTQKLGFVPQTTLNEGIPRFVEWYMNFGYLCGGPAN